MFIKQIHTRRRSATNSIAERLMKHQNIEPHIFDKQQKTVIIKKRKVRVDKSLDSLKNAKSTLTCGLNLSTQTYSSGLYNYSTLKSIDDEYEKFMQEQPVVRRKKQKRLLPESVPVSFIIPPKVKLTSPLRALSQIKVKETNSFYISNFLYQRKKMNCNFRKTSATFREQKLAYL